MTAPRAPHPATDTPASTATPEQNTGNEVPAIQPPSRLSMNELAGLVGVSPPTIRRFFKDPARLSRHMHDRIEAVLAQIGLLRSAAPQSDTISPDTGPDLEATAAHPSTSEQIATDTGGDMANEPEASPAALGSDSSLSAPSGEEASPPEMEEAKPPSRKPRKPRRMAREKPSSPPAPEGDAEPTSHAPASSPEPALESAPAASPSAPLPTNSPPGGDTGTEDVYELLPELAQDAMDHGDGLAASGALTIDTVAQLAGVSTKTVSRYFNTPGMLSARMRARVEAVIAETGFVPNTQARALALGRNFLVALVHDGSDQGIREAVEAGMIEGLEGSSLALVLKPLAPHRDDSLAALEHFLAQHRPCGIVTLPPISENPALLEACRATQTACVRLGHLRDATGLCGNDRAAMASLVSRLVELGHQRIGLVTGPDGSMSVQEREMGYLDAMADHGLDRGPTLIETGDNSFASGMTAGQLLLEISPRPSAIIATNDTMAAGLLHAAGEYRLQVPEDLSIIGFDDTGLAAMTWPPLTSMHVPWHAMGAEAVRRLRAGMEPTQQERPPPVFELRLAERGSVAARAPELP